MKIFRGGETEKLTPKKLSLLPRESTQCFGEVQNFTRKTLLLLFVLSYCSSLTGKQQSQLEKHNAGFCSRGNGKKKKKRGPRLPPSYPLLRHIFFTIVGLCSFPLVAMASERQMPCFHFKTEFPYKQNCFHLRIFSPSHSIRAVFKRMCLLKVWMKIHCILLIREEIYSSFLRTRKYRKIFSK